MSNESLFKAKNQTSIDSQNMGFWNELCGSHLASVLGINDSSIASLKKFDDWYMDYYPYLYSHIPFSDLKNKTVLEVGLGYGTVSQIIASSGARYSGLDIADGPVQMVNHRLYQNNLKGKALQHSVLDCPYPDQKFDILVSIGCIHHTGNIQLALNESWRVLKPGGQAFVMIYYAYSYRRWIYYFKETALYFLWDKFGIGNAFEIDTPEARARYDCSENGSGAPETVFISKSHMKKMTKNWRSAKFYTENIGFEGIFKRFKRKFLCNTFGSIMGLDLYCHLTK